ncbi:hypothetical protein [Cellulomonas xiejunii]|uniref:hypothetical protein n=1 Tax=Cellulomonas xiejunii TaxID=2968083 RepID=UPI001D0DFA65|nr:hypothetical protein [Cellulomonas xiejunii]MCC2313613.1 hypothetical protein [Cellulomonas xiejunii]
MNRALAVLTVVAYLTLPLGSASSAELAPTLLVGLAYCALAIVGFRFAEGRLWKALITMDGQHDDPGAVAGARRVLESVLADHAAHA